MTAIEGQLEARDAGRGADELAADLQRARLQIAALEQLLEVHEQTSVDQAAKLERALADQKRLKQEVEFERARLNQALMQAPAAITVVEGPEHVVVMQNEHARALGGGMDLLGKRIQDVFPEIEAQGLLALQDQVFQSGEAYVGNEVRIQIPARDGFEGIDGYFNFVYQPLRAMSGEVYGILTHAVDVTDQVRARQFVEEKVEELARLSAELERSNRDLERSNRDLDQFAYVASHDLKAPLRGIANLTQWIQEDLGDRISGESREHMQLLKGRVNRMEALIDAILAYSRAGRTREKSEEVNTAGIVAETVELLAPPATARVEIAPDLPVIVSERVPLQQVFMNLIGNALKYAERPDVHVRIAAEPEGALVRFSVSDNGPGIEPQFQERIWQIFQTLAPRDKVEGTGIGLSVVKKLVESRGGSVALTSTPGKGSTFSFTWPTHARTIE